MSKMVIITWFSIRQSQFMWYSYIYENKSRHRCVRLLSSLPTLKRLGLLHYFPYLKCSRYIHCNKFLQNYHKNQLNVTMNYTKCIENCCKPWFYVWWNVLQKFPEISKLHYSRPSLCWQIHDIWYKFCFIINWKK